MKNNIFIFCCMLSLVVLAACKKSQQPFSIENAVEAGVNVHTQRGIYNAVESSMYIAKQVQNWPNTRTFPAGSGKYLRNHSRDLSLISGDLQTLLSDERALTKDELRGFASLKLSIDMINSKLRKVDVE